MPRGRPRKADSEILPPEDEQPRGRKKLVEAEHTIKYTSPVPVTVEEPEGDAELELLEGELVREKPKRRVNNEREELRRKLAKSNITPATQLKLTIERYLHSEAVDGSGGMFAETEHCTKYACNEHHVTSEDYLDAARKWGPGLYRFTLRMNHQIVTAWDKRISPGTVVTGQQIIQHAIPGDPTSPQVIVQMPDGQQTATVFDPVKAMKEQTLAFKQQLENYKLMRDVFGPVVETSQQTGNPDPDTAFVHTLLTDNAKLKEKISNGLIGQILGSKAVEDDPSWGAVVMKAVEKGEVSQAINALGQVAAMLLDRILPRKDNNNGQAQMGVSPHQTVQLPQVPSGETGQGQPQTENLAQGNQGALPSGGQNIDAQTPEIGEASQEQVAPEQEALRLVIDHCQKKLPPQIAFNRLVAYADAINEQAPQYSIDGYLDMFAQMTPDQALEFVKTQPNGEAVVALEHTKAWTENLQKLIRESQEGEGE